MIKKLLSTFAIFCIFGVITVTADSVPIKFDPDDGKDKSEVPVTGGYDNDSKELALKFSECEVYDVAVIGTEG